MNYADTLPYCTMRDCDSELRDPLVANHARWQGDCLEQLQRLTDSLNIAPYISSAGWVDDTELFTYLSALDVCLAPDPPVPINQLSAFIRRY